MIFVIISTYLKNFLIIGTPFIDRFSVVKQLPMDFSIPLTKLQPFGMQDVYGIVKMTKQGEINEKYVEISKRYWNLQKNMISF